ncbi:dihydrofolate reductase [Conexibacter sp. W3-3-2]|uniref:dihydrofolate reductase family protein n=1 Tax=Conexibacter sp. W3-3-2 TaxID=2675227 RepID=UPI0012B77882|nr:dihydrofolate reductase family protein [Conexibacter sp. W3-3-2]MTD43226.1 dihydrofolate reductase [Conexibacter sp. W3-3-2]
MLLVSMGVSVDGFISDRDGAIDWSVPSDELFAFHLERVGELGAMLLGRRLYETMLVWETDPAMRRTAADAAFADTWAALPKVVFSRTLDAVQGTNTRLAAGTLEEELARLTQETGGDVEIGGADLAGQAFAQGLVDELRLFRGPAVLGGGTPLLPAVDRRVPLTLVEVRTFDQVIYERYRVARPPADRGGVS